MFEHAGTMGGGPNPSWLKRFWGWFVAAGGVIALFYYWSLLIEWLRGLFGPLIADDGHPTWRLVALAAIVGGVAVSAPFLFLYIRGKRNSERDGHAAGLTEGREAGVREGRSAGYEEGLTAGRQEGEAEGFRKGETHAQSQPAVRLTAPFVEPVIAVHKRLVAANLEQHATAVIAEYANLVNDWSHAITSVDLTRDQSAGAELALGATTLQKYLEQVRTQRLPSTQRTLLPANYEIYAWCVARVLERLAELRSNNGETIRVWTHFKKDLKRWYNIASGKGDCAYSHLWWEQYKRTVVSIKSPQSSGAPTHSIQMRRLVTTDTAVAESSLVFQTESSEPLTITGARQRFEHRQGCPTLAEEVKKAFGLPGKFNNVPIHIIAECECGAKRHENWETLKHHFEVVYHDYVISKDIEFSDHDKGVYCAYTSRIPADYSYDDVFLVDMADLNSGLFGVAYYASPAGELDGIVILTDIEIRNLINSFYAPAWHLACQQ